jgi:hypothetical protein
MSEQIDASSGGTLPYDLAIPSLTDGANIQKALRLYHYGNELGTSYSSTSIAGYLELLAPKASPTFTGNVTLPSTTVIGSVSATELSYLDGATSNIQTQLNAQTNTSIWFGDGSDGDVTISSPSTPLTRDMFYNNLTLSGTGTLITNGYRVFVKGVFDVSAAASGAIVDNGSTGVAPAGSAGGNASGATPGTGGAGGSNSAGGPLSPSSGSAGGAGGVNTGNCVAGTNLQTTTSVFPDSAYLGAVGGSGGSATGTGGVGGTQTSPTLTFGGKRFWVDWTPLAAGKLFTNAGGSGGGGGGGSSSTPSLAAGGGGGGGAGARSVAIYARTIHRSSSTGTGFINLVGGAGGRGGNAASGASVVGHGGGGGGGQGGFVYIVYGNLTGTSKTNAIRSIGGDGGGPGGSGAGTPGSRGGANGAIMLINVTTGVFSYTAPTLGTLGNANAAGVGNTASVTL